MRRFLLATSLFALVGLTVATADDPPAQPAQPKVGKGQFGQPGQPAQPFPGRQPLPATILKMEEEVESLEAHRDVKIAYVKAAELGVKGTELNLARLLQVAPGAVSRDEVEKAKLEVEVARVQVAIRQAELKEVDVKIKYAKKRLEDAKARMTKLPKDEPKGSDSIPEKPATNPKVTIEKPSAGVPQPLPDPGKGPPDLELPAPRAKAPPTPAGPTPSQVPPVPGVQRATSPKIAVFNMAAVMRDYGKAKYQVYQLNEKRKNLTKELAGWRAEYVRLQVENQTQTVAAIREANQKKMVELARKVEDKDREINKILNDEASKIIAELYDEIKLVVDKTAEMNGYDVVFAYPDAVTAEELKSPVVKELKLKPPAAQPFFVAKQVDITGVVIQTLNAWDPAPPVPEGAYVDGLVTPGPNATRLNPFGSLGPTGGPLPSIPPIPK